MELMVPQKGFIRVQTISEGDVPGWSWLVPPYRWRFNARACKATRALAFDAKCLRTRCEQDHDLGYELLKRFAHIVTDRLDATLLFPTVPPRPDMGLVDAAPNVVKLLADTL